MAKLIIRADVGPSTDPSTLDSIKSCLHTTDRLGEITISAFSESLLEKLFQGLVPKSAPQLHTFRIVLCSNYPKPNTFTIHENILSDMERLRCVHLVECKISWDSRLLTVLTHLTLHRSLKDNASSSIIQFMHALQRMPALINLDIQQSIPHDAGGLSTYLTVDLPCLRELRILSDVDALTIALSHISFPHSAVLDLTCEATQHTQIDFSNFLSVLARKFLSFLVIRSLSLEVANLASQNSLRFELTANAQNHFFYHRSVPVELKLILTWPYLQDSLHKHMEIMNTALGALSLPDVAQLALSTPDMNSKMWLDTFGKFPLLKWVPWMISLQRNHFFLHWLIKRRPRQTTN